MESDFQNKFQKFQSTPTRSVLSTRAEINQIVATECVEAVTGLSVCDGRQKSVETNAEIHSGNTDSSFGKSQNTAYVLEMGCIYDIFMYFLIKLSVDFPSSSSIVMDSDLDLGTTTSFYILSNSTFKSHPINQRYLNLIIS